MQQRFFNRLFFAAALTATLAALNAAAQQPQPPAFQDRGAADKRDFDKSDETARAVSYIVYDYYAKVIKERTGFTKGLCIDAGSGSGNLGLAVTRATDMDMIFLDFSSRALEAADKNIVRYRLEKRARTMLADVHSIPLPDSSVDLVVSISSLGSWKDLPGALKEIYRVLKPGGKTYIGVGNGTPETRALVAAKRKELGLPEDNRGIGRSGFGGLGGPNGPGKPADGNAKPADAGKPADAAAQPASGSGASGHPGPNANGPARRGGMNFEDSLKEAGVPRYVIYHGDDGMWIMMQK